MMSEDQIKKALAGKLSEEDKQKLSLDDAFMLALEEKAAKVEVTVDYYMEEFM